MPDSDQPEENPKPHLVAAAKFAMSLMLVAGYTVEEVGIASLFIRASVAHPEWAAYWANNLARAQEGFIDPVAIDVIPQALPAASSWVVPRPGGGNYEDDDAEH